MKLGLDPLDWPEISGLLDQALALPATERAAWLGSLEGAPARHRDTLARLLGPATGVETGDLLDRLPRFTIGATGAAAAAPMAGLRAGDLVGPYLVLAELGHGGMGAVWLAERIDALPRRKVALKLPQAGWSTGLSERLARERDILASLEHPNIARLYDAGVDELGRPYLTLEYIDGTPIDRHCSERGLAVEARLGLLLQVAEAVAHAHAHLVVHRDLKPSNILVTERGDVRLLDFGIAKLLSDDRADASELTRMTGSAFTPDYASPEQIRGETIGTASDVYSLGVVAYELLAGVKPYRIGTAGLRDPAVEIASIDAPAASRAAADPALRRRLAGDLDAILNRALKKAPSERYPTVAAFADDIRRHLADAPVLARPDSVAYRARKFVARNALQVGAASLVVVALVAGSGVALWQARAARLEAQRAEQVKRFALSIFEEADSHVGGGPQTTAADLLKQARRRVREELGDRPDVAVELMSSIGYSLIGQGQLDDALAVAAEALELGRSKLGRGDPRTMTAGLVYGEALNDAGRVREAIPILREALAAARALDATQELVEGQLRLASALVKSGDAAAATAEARVAVEVVTTRADRVTPLVAAQAWGGLANILNATGGDGLTAAARRALELDPDARSGRITASVLTARAFVANGMALDGDLRGSVEELRRVVDDAIRVHGPTHHKVAFLAGYLGARRLEVGDAAGSVAAMEIAVRATTEGGGGDINLAFVQLRLADALAAAGRLDAAVAAYESTTLSLGRSGVAHPWLGWQTSASQSVALAQLGRLDEAERLFPIAVGKTLSGARLAGWQSRLSELRRIQGRHEEAIELAAAAVAGFDKPATRVERAHAQRRLGSALLAAGRPREAVAPLRTAVEFYRREQVAESPMRVVAEADLGRAESADTATAAAAAKEKN